MSDTLITPETTTDSSTVLHTPGLWRVVFYNDDYTPMIFVTDILGQIFHKDTDTAARLTLTVHETGQAEIGLYTKEIATTKVMQVTWLADQHGHPLLATAEAV